MQEKIIIFLQTKEETYPHWVICDSSGEVREHTIHGEPEQLVNAVNGREVMVLVPAEDVLLVNVELPKMSRSRLVQAIPYALEEQLIDDVDLLHFAAAPHHEDHRLPVAIVGRDKMMGWLKQLSTWQVRPDMLTPCLFAVPYEVQTWHVLLEQQHALVRVSPYEGFSCDRNNLLPLLTLALNEHPPAPSLIHIHNYSGQPWGKQIANVEIEEEMHPTDELYPDLALYGTQSANINLLQGSFATRKSRRLQQGKLWKVITIIAALWVGILFLYPTVSYFILKQKLQVVDQEISALYKQHFPQASSVIAPKLRMQEKLQRINSGMDQNHSLLLIGYLSKVMPKAVGIKLKKMDYQNNRLTLDLTATSSDELANFTDALTKLGLKVKQQNANLTGALVNATLTIE